MSVASPWCFPDPRTAASWRPARSPGVAWLAFLRVQHLEALVECDPFVPLARFERLVLAAFPSQGGVSRDLLESKLHVGATLLAQVLRRLADADLIVLNESGTWTLTPLGHQACAEGRHRRHERRSFAFVERPDQPPHFLVLHGGGGIPAEAAPVDPAHLADCIRQADDWKQQHGFPADVTGVMAEGPRAIALVQSSWLPVYLQTRGGALAARHFSVDGTLSATLVFELGKGWREVLPQLEQPWSGEQARQAWADWCLALGLHNLHATDAILAEGKLCVRLPREQAQSARQQSGSAPWALVGADNIRQLIPLDIVAS